MHFSPAPLHIPDGFLSVVISVVCWAITIVALGLAISKTNKALGEKQVPLMGVMAAFIFAAQGMAYYLLIAWLPAVYAEDGGNAAVTAALAGVFNASTLPGILLFPIWSDRLGQRKVPTIAASVLFTVGVAGLTVAPLAEPLRWVWPALAGAGVAGVFGMALVMPADLAPAGRTGRAAGMVLAVGYAGSALGPLAAGLARDLTGSFDASLILLPIVGIAMTIAAFATPEMPGRARGAGRAGRQAP